jgi:Ca-activated chloride channel family protein
VPLLIVTHYAFLKYTRRKAIKFANFQALKRVSNSHILTKNYTVLTMRVIIIICLVLAIVGTTLWYKGKSSNNDFIIAIDTSSSMTSQDFSPTRLEAAKQYTKTLVDNIDPAANIGIISFAGSSFIEHLPDKDKTAIKDAVSNILIAQEGGTDIAGAMVTATNMLINSKNGKSMVIITDGSNTVSFFNKDPIGEGIAYAKRNNIIVYTIGLGTNGGPIGYLPEYYNISSVYDADTLIRIANETGGKYYYAQNNTELEATFEGILSNTKEAYIPLPLDMIMAILAFLLILIEWGMISTRFRSIP